MTLVGIDYSMTCPAVCVYSANGNPRMRWFYINDLAVPVHVGARFSSVPPSAYTNPTHRYLHLASKTIEFIKSIEPDFNLVNVGLEDYAFGARGRVFHIGENTGILKLKLIEAGLASKNLEVIAPTVVKKIATGKGNAKKEPVVEAFHRDTGIDLMRVFTPNRKNVGSPVSDLADSFYVLHAAAGHFKLDIPRFL